MAKYLIVKIEDDSDLQGSQFAQVRKILHTFPGVSDMGVGGASPLTDSERRLVMDAFESGMRRAKASQKANERQDEGTPEGFRWVSGLLEEDRHLRKLYQREVLCGTFSDGPRITSTHKEKCPGCVALARALL